MASRKRLIDANAVVESLTNFTPNGWGKDVPYIRSEWAMAVKIKDNFMKAITEAPIVDAVEVVRCKDCKHHRDKNEQEQQYLAKDTLICTSQDATEDCWNAVWPDHFCSCGERKDGDRNG